MSKTRTTISVDESLLNRAKEKEVNISALTERALEKEVDRPQYHMLNTSRNWLEDKLGDTEFDTTAIYSNGVAAQFGGCDRGENIDTGDTVISYVDQDSARAVGKALAGWHKEPVDPAERVVLDEDHDMNEYHLPVFWIAVVGPGKGLSSTVIEKITEGQPAYSGTHNKLSREHGELIADAIIGRAYRTF